MYQWESQELLELEGIRELVTQIWSHTELETSMVSKHFLLKELSRISELVNDAVFAMDAEIDRLTLRDTKAMRHVCSSCESDKVYICDPCMEKMSNG